VLTTALLAFEDSRPVALQADKYQRPDYNVVLGGDSCLRDKFAVNGHAIYWNLSKSYSLKRTGFSQLVGVGKELLAFPPFQCKTLQHSSLNM
jgi:hypothetical protein